MASIANLFSAVVITCVCFGNANNEFVSVRCQRKNVGQFGHQSLLDCVIHTSEEVKDPHILAVTWTKVGDEEPLLKYLHGSFSQREGFRFAEPSWDEKNMNVSLLITNTEIQHEGEYKCMVFTDSGHNTQQTFLSVTATYNKPIITSNPKNIQQGQDFTLTCDTDGGYPQGQLRWYVNVETDWTKSAKLQARRGPDGRFQLTSTLKLLSGSTFSKYTCVVFNASGGKEQEDKFDLEKTNTDRQGSVEEPSVNHSKWVAPVVVIGSLIIGLLLLLLFFRRRSQREHEAVSPCDSEEGACDVEKGDHA